MPIISPCYKKGNKPFSNSGNLFILLLLFIVIRVPGQVVSSSYTFSQPVGIVYNLITGTDPFNSSSWDDAVTTVSFPISPAFVFNFNGTNYTSCSINTNGYITFGNTVSASNQYNAISSSLAYAGAIGVFSRDLVNNGSSIQYTTIGTSPNRIFVIQWTNARRYNSGPVVGDILNFQVRLSETSNIIEIIYGTCSATSTIALTSQVGLRGIDNTDFNNRTSAVSWSGTTTGTVNTDAVTSKNTDMPASGLTYRYTPVSLFTSPVSPLLYCSGNSLPVSFTSTNITFNAGNIFTAQISASNGSFAAPVNIGSLTSTASNGTIPSSIPIGTIGGSGYRIRVVASSPATTGLDNGNNIQVNQSSVAPAALNAASSSLCSGSSTVLSQTGGTLGTGATWKWYSDAAFTIPAGITATSNASLAVSPVNTTTYYLRSEGNTSPCASITGDNSKWVTVVVNQQPVLNGVNSNPTCNGSPATIQLSGLIPNSISSITYSINGGSNQAVTGIIANNSGTGTFLTNVLTTANNGQLLTVTTITRTDVTPNCGPVTISNNNTTSLIVKWEWTGANNSTNWNDATNWCGGIPNNSSADITIPLVASNFYPLADTAYMVHNITISPGATISVATGGSLTITGSYSNSGAVSNKGLFRLNGVVTQNFPGVNATVTAMKDLEINNSAGVNIDKKFVLSGALIPTNGTITLADTITLHSDALGTARIAALGNGAGFNYINNGRFRLERYIPARRAWRLLCAPLAVNQAPGINSAWQEGVVQQVAGSTVNPNPGYGTHITGGTVSNGFDQNLSGNPSLKELVGGNWQAISSTYQLITNRPGYMIFIRGSRANDLTLGSAAPADNTTLRMSGQVRTGDQITNMSVGSGYALIANPYPSAIDLHHLAISNSTVVNDNFKIWDARLGGTNNVGGYVTLSWNPALNSGSGGYDYAPDPAGAYNGNVSGYIPSGEAFFINPKNTGNVIQRESDKTALGSDNVFNPVSLDERIRINLKSFNSDITLPVVDGVLVNYDTLFSASTDSLDAEKLHNQNTENISMLRQGKEFSIERRPLINTNDSIFLYMVNMKPRNYQLEILTQNLDHPNLTAFLEDNYTSSLTPVILNGNTLYPFNVNGDSGSYAPTRFRILFGPTGTVPVFFISVKATQQNSQSVHVEWMVENQIHIDHYEIERSPDGRNFIPVGRVDAYNGVSLKYDWIDNNPLSGNNFYRISSLDLNGFIQYSKIVKVTIGLHNPGITVYPNPLNSKELNIRFHNMKKGEYTVKLFNEAGQLLLQKIFYYTGRETGTSIFKLALSAGYKNSNYILEVIDTSNDKTIEQVVILK